MQISNILIFVYKANHLDTHAKVLSSNRTCCGLKTDSTWKRDTRSHIVRMGGTCLRCHRTHAFRRLWQGATTDAEH